MAFPIKELRQKKADLLQENRTLLDQAHEQSRDLNAEEQVRFDKNTIAVADAGAQIARIEVLMDQERQTGAHHEWDGKSATDALPSSGAGRAGFANMGEFMATLFRKTRGDFDERLRALQISAAATNEGMPSQGGFAVPSEFIVRAFTEDLDDTVLLKLCDRVPMSAKEMKIPGFADDSHATTSPYGITWNQIAESGSFGDAQVLPFKAIQLTANKSGALFACSNEWLVDANPAMRARIDGIFRASLRWYIESLLWAGTGAGQPLGALIGPGTLSIPKEVGQESATIYTENIVKMWARLRPSSLSRAIWVGNPTTFPQLATLTVGVGTGGALTGLLQTNRGVAGEPATGIFGRPLYLSEHLPAVGAAGDLVLLDPLLYILGDRQQVTMDASPHVRFQYDETTFRVTARLDGQPALASVLTPKNGSTLAWAVKIAVRS